jgi:hypothetical protein
LMKSKMGARMRRGGPHWPPSSHLRSTRHACDDGEEEDVSRPSLVVDVEDEEDEEDVGCRMCGNKLFVHKYILSYYNYLRYLLEIHKGIVLPTYSMYTSPAMV